MIEPSNQNAKVIVGYGPANTFNPFAKSLPAMLEINSQLVRLYILAPDKITQLNVIFELTSSQIQKVTFTPWFVSIKANQTRYIIYLAYKRGGPNFPKEYGNWSGEFGFFGSFKKINLLARTFRSVGIKTRNYAYLIIGLILLFLAVNIPNFIHLYNSFYHDFFNKNSG